VLWLPAVPRSVGAGAALHVAVFSHLVSCIPPSPSDRNCLAQLEEPWESVGPSLESGAEVWEVRELGSAGPLLLSFPSLPSFLHAEDKSHPPLLGPLTDERVPFTALYFIAS